MTHSCPWVVIWDGFPKKKKKKKKRAPAPVEGLGGSGILLSHDVKVFLGTSSVGHYNQ